MHGKTTTFGLLCPNQATPPPNQNFPRTGNSMEPSVDKRTLKSTSPLHHHHTHNTSHLMHILHNISHQQAPMTSQAPVTSQLFLICLGRLFSLGPERGGGGATLGVAVGQEAPHFSVLRHKRHSHLGTAAGEGRVTIRGGCSTGFSGTSPGGESLALKEWSYSYESGQE